MYRRGLHGDLYSLCSGSQYGAHALSLPCSEPSKTALPQSFNTPLSLVFFSFLSGSSATATWKDLNSLTWINYQVTDQSVAHILSCPGHPTDLAMRDLTLSEHHTSESSSNLESNSRLPAYHPLQVDFYLFPSYFSFTFAEEHKITNWTPKLWTHIPLISITFHLTRIIFSQWFRWPHLTVVQQQLIICELDDSLSEGCSQLAIKKSKQASWSLVFSFEDCLKFFQSLVFWIIKF